MVTPHCPVVERRIECHTDAGKLSHVSKSLVRGQYHIVPWRLKEFIRPDFYSLLLLQKQTNKYTPSLMLDLNAAHRLLSIRLSRFWHNDWIVPQSKNIDAASLWPSRKKMTCDQLLHSHHVGVILPSNNIAPCIKCAIDTDAFHQERVVASLRSHNAKHGVWRPETYRRCT